MSAKRILMLATGENKAEAVKAMLFGEITPQMPASALRFHQSVDVIITKDIGDLIGIWNIKVN
jgi:glucosamine-6-phosphate deaminase